MRFLQGVPIKALSEGKQLLAETQWIVGPADLGQNYYARPDYTEVSSLYAALFDTDIPSVKGYKELFDMKAVTKAGTTRNVKYLVICFKDAASGKWKVFSTLDNIDDESALDIEQEITFCRDHLKDTRVTSARENYATYGEWLLRSGRLKEAQAALESAKAASTAKGIDNAPFIDHALIRQINTLHDIQIDAVLEVIAKIVPQAAEGSR
jgi:hypothetical protein